MKTLNTYAIKKKARAAKKMGNKAEEIVKALKKSGKMKKVTKKARK